MSYLTRDARLFDRVSGTLADSQSSVEILSPLRRETVAIETLINGRFPQSLHAGGEPKKEL